MSQHHGLFRWFLLKQNNGDIRICIEPRELNNALLREPYTLPVFEVTLHELGQTKVFSKADISSGYWHVQLDEASSLLTTFQTCFGDFRWLRLPFGISASSEIFQKRLLEGVKDLPGVICIADDVDIHGKTLEEHDHRLDQFLAKCQDKNTELNKSKLMLRSDRITFMSYLITKEGLQTDPEKIKIIIDFPVPQNLEELRCFLGMVNYLSRFLSSVTSEMHPLHKMLLNDVRWTCSEAQEESFRRIKEKSQQPWKDGKPVAFLSRTLCFAERNYAHIEKEILVFRPTEIPSLHI